VNDFRLARYRSFLRHQGRRPLLDTTIPRVRSTLGTYVEARKGNIIPATHILWGRVITAVILIAAAVIGAVLLVGPAKLALGALVLTLAGLLVVWVRALRGVAK
jgi:hypothetical protein